MSVKIALSLLILTQCTLAFASSTSEYLEPRTSMMTATIPPLFINSSPGCLNMTTPEEIIECANETAAAIADSAGDLPECVNTTLSLLASCSLESLDTCVETCQGISFDFGDELDVTDLATCNQIQENVMTPLCANNCCPQCQQELEEVAECFVDDVLGFTVRECDLSCGDGAI